MRKSIEKIIIITTILLGIWSIIMVLSTTINSPNLNSLYIKQTGAFFIGLMIMLIMRNFSFEILEEMSLLFFIVTIFMLVGVLVFGPEINGSRRWFNLGIFYFQPVEFAKLAVILFLAVIIEKYDRLIYGIIPVLIVMILVMSQPDAGSSILFLPVLAMMLLVSRVNTEWMIFALPYTVIMAMSLLLECYLNVRSNSLMSSKNIIYPLLVTGIIYFIFREMKNINRHIKFKKLILAIMLFWISFGAGILGSNVLKVYQKKRIVAFLIPSLDPLGTGYNIRQSLLAVGSGKVLGRGLFGGTQTQLGFLPVRHTDFIFASVAEELGLIGASIMLFLIGLLLWQILKIIERTEHMGGKLIAAGIFALMLTQVIMNLGVTLGMLPVIGIQLPFVSYGGTGMVLFMTMIGILLNINKRTEILGK